MGCQGCKGSTLPLLSLNPFQVLGRRPTRAFLRHYQTLQEPRCLISNWHLSHPPILITCAWTYLVDIDRDAASRGLMWPINLRFSLVDYLSSFFYFDGCLQDIFSSPSLQYS